MSRRRQQLCPTPSKVCYPNLDSAQDGYLYELMTSPGRPFETIPRYAYPCCCRQWHRTNKPGGTNTVRLRDQ